MEISYNDTTETFAKCRRRRNDKGHTEYCYVDSKYVKSKDDECVLEHYPTWHKHPWVITGSVIDVLCENDFTKLKGLNRHYLTSDASTILVTEENKISSLKGLKENLGNIKHVKALNFLSSQLTTIDCDLPIVSELSILQDSTLTSLKGISNKIECIHKKLVLGTLDNLTEGGIELLFIDGNFKLQPTFTLNPTFRKNHIKTSITNRRNLLIFIRIMEPFLAKPRHIRVKDLFEVQDLLFEAGLEKYAEM